MTPAFILITASVLGIDIGWQPLEQGGVEYIIQIAPNEVDRFVNTHDIIDDVPKSLDVRRYRFTIGTEKLPRTTSEPTTASTEEPATLPASNREPIIPRVPTEPDERAETFVEHDPAPTNEEKAESTAESKPDALFKEPDRLTTKRSERPTENADYEAQKPPTLPSSFRTAGVTSRTSTDDAATSEAWLPLLVAMFLLFMSMGGNVYLAWIAWEARSRCRLLLDKVRAQ